MKKRLRKKRRDRVARLLLMKWTKIPEVLVSGRVSSARSNTSNTLKN